MDRPPTRFDHVRGGLLTKWLEVRLLRSRTRETYESVLRLRTLTRLLVLSLSLRLLQVQSAPGNSLDSVSRLPGRAVKAYRTLHAIMNTAVADEVIYRNPCQVRGASSERSPERPTVSIPEVSAAIEAMPERLQAAGILATWCTLRRGELLGLERRDFNLLHGTVSVQRSAHWAKGGFAIGPPKTDAGVRRPSESLQTSLGRSKAIWSAS